jgi:hypothetical protein
MFIVISEKQCELRRSGIRVRSQMSLLRSSSLFLFVTINIGLLRSQRNGQTPGRWQRHRFLAPPLLDPERVESLTYSTGGVATGY